MSHSNNKYILLVRHPESISNKFLTDNIHNDIDILKQQMLQFDDPDITLNGINQAIITKNYILSHVNNILSVFRSPMKRTKFISSQIPAPSIIIDELIEYNSPCKKKFF